MRELRQKSYEQCVPVLRDYIQSAHPDDATSYRLAMMFDRMSKRLAGIAPSQAESWHRDIAPGNDEIFGGWINLDDQPQKFILAAGSHLDPGARHPAPGFDIIPVKDHPQMNSRRYVAEIPGGYQLIFLHHIAHEVNAVPPPKDSFRVYIGWQITTDTEPMYLKSSVRSFKESPSMRGVPRTLITNYVGLEQVIRDQGVPKLTGGGDPFMYNSRHRNYSVQRETLIRFAETFQMVIQVQDKVKDTSFTSIPITLESLRQYGLPLFPDYSPEEIRMFYPV